jgi:hypothetical protein
MECTYCKNTFSNNNSLICHQKTAKYCLEMQGLKKNTYMCDSCDKILSTKNRLLTHYTSCIKHNQKNNNVSFNLEKQQLLEKIQTLESLLTKKDEHIEKLENKLESLLTKKDEHIAILESKLENIAIKAVERNFEDDNDFDTDEFVCDGETNDEEYKLQPLDVGNGFTIEHREEDGFINVTNLCKADKKQFSDWNELDETDDFLEVLSSSIGLPPNELIKYKICSIDEKEIWTHPQVAINIAQWISPTFDVKVSSWVYEAMMTGKVYITNTKSYKELQKENKNKDLKIQFLTKKNTLNHNLEFSMMKRM